MVNKPFTLEDFVTESNRIEGLGPAQKHEIEAHRVLLALSVLTVQEVSIFVDTIARAKLRRHLGMDVRVGYHYPPRGGPEIELSLALLLEAVSNRSLAPYSAHIQYETLHPFMDGNGRSGRAIWLWQMMGKAPFGFLHTWYYQSLDGRR